QKMLDALIPDKVPMDVLHAVLRLLLDEQVSIRNLSLILEAVAEARAVNAQPEAICEHVRQRLGFQIVSGLRRGDGTLPLVQLAPEWEDTFSSYQVDADRGLDIALPPDLFNRLADNVAERLQDAGNQGIFPAIVTNTRRRRFLKTLMRAKGMNNPVLSFEEIGVDARPSLVGVVAA
ncbi:MAG: FHIPEP family type III secretion protein, partial [Pseudomonadota bacterium]